MRGEWEVVMRRTPFLAALLVFAWGGIVSAAAEIKVLSPGSTEAAFSELLPQFEKASGQTIKIGYGPAGALAACSLSRFDNSEGAP